MKIFSLVLLLIVTMTITAGASSWLDMDMFERDDGGYFTLKTDVGDIITKTARILDMGDSYISADNQRYQVVGFNDDDVLVEMKEVIQLPDVSEILATNIEMAEASDDDNWKKIAIYHSHNAESYVPTSGDAFDEEGGDVLEVGKVLAESFENQGFEVIWTDASHLPHDGEAYSRSRRTVMDLIEEQPGTLLDVHRDATPPEVYETEINGESATKVRLVVGRQNQNREATMDYAKRIKAVADEEFPGLIEGIFDARGNYNQDMGPRVILLEFGAHTNSLDDAKKAAEIFSKVIPAAAGLSPEAAAWEGRRIGGVALTSILWILAITALIIVGFVILNKQGIVSIGSFFRREFSGGKGNDDDSDDN